MKNKANCIDLNTGNIVKKIVLTEHQEQSLVISWAQTQLNVYPALENLYAVPNASKCSIGAGKWRKKEGLSAGVPDLVLAVQNKEYGSLYIEMKRADRKNEKNGGLTDSQMEWKKRLCSHGMMHAVCYSFEEAKEVILVYLSNKNQHECVLLTKLKGKNNELTKCN